MKKLLLFAFYIAFTIIATAQNNPVQNLTWYQTYQMPNNFFELKWDAPASPHNELLGYNIYRNGELYRFQTETSLYNLYTDVYGYVSNCDANFLAIDNQNQPYTDGFDVYVTAVYNPDQVESEYLQTYHTNPPALEVTTISQGKALLYPNPTNGLLSIGNLNLTKIIVYDSAGKALKEFLPATQINVSDLPKGTYILQLFSERELITDKIVIE